MASLQVPSSPAQPSTAPSSQFLRRRPFYPKPSPMITTHAKRCHRLRASSQNDTPAGKVDRRNMLLGIGGLYGATNLISNQAAVASPIQAPEIDKCGAAVNLNTPDKDVLDINCCPPYTQTIIDYKLPQFNQLKIRHSAHRVPPEYIKKYNAAIAAMKKLPENDPRSFMQQANVHCAYCNGAYNQAGSSVNLQVHNSWLFFPFHRWYLYFYERILGKLIDDPTFALPFWNWDNPKGMTIPPMFNEEKSAIYDPKRNQNRLKSVVDLGMTNNTDPLQLVTNNLTIMHTEMIRGNSTAYDFMGKPYRQGTLEENSGPGASERGSHTAIHVFVGDPREPSGENLGNFYSAGRDPLFYCHHGNVDRMWYLWQQLPSDQIKEKRILDPDFLGAQFLFYDEEARLVRVTVRDAVDTVKMGYDYQRIDLPWLDFRPPPQTAQAKIKRVGASTAPKAENVFPLKLEKVERFQVSKTQKGNVPELLVLENIEVDTSKFLKFDVFINDEDDNAFELDKAAYAGTYAQVPHKSAEKYTKSTISLRLTDLYKDMDIADDDSVVVTLVPRHHGPGVTIGGIKIEAEPAAK